MKNGIKTGVIVALGLVIIYLMNGQSKHLKWRIIAGHSEEKKDMFAISIQPLPETNAPIVVYFPTNAVFVGEILDEVTKFSFKYVIKTNN